MTITAQAAAALALTRGIAALPPRTQTAHRRRTRAATGRDITAMLGVAPARVVVRDDLLREYGGQPGLLITVHEPDDGGTVWRFVPETGNTGLGGGAYLLLDQCPGCFQGGVDGWEVPMATISCLADLGLYLESARAAEPGDPHDEDRDGVAEVPVEFFGDPGHAPGCPLS